MFLVGIAALVTLQSSSGPNATRLEAEDAVLGGHTISSARPGYSGKGFVTGFTNTNRITWHLSAKAGIYQFTLGFSTPSGHKGYDLSVNGSTYSGMLPDTGPKFSTASLGKVELKSGDNLITIGGGWGYFDVDYLDVAPAAKSPLPKAPPRTPVDPKASPAARALYSYLASIYGKGTLSGQYEIDECNYVRQTTGKSPAILGGDLIDYSPSRVAHGSKPAGTTEQYIKAVKSGQILTLSWHWNAPSGLIDKVFTDASGNKVEARWYSGFYSRATTFDVEKALANPDSDDYRLMLSDIDTIAVELKKLDAANVPVLWRPLHEAEGGWFWWGAKGPEPCKKLYRLMFDRLTKHHGLHNLIWVWNSTDPAWYPGDDVVDIVSIDSYPSDHSDTLSSQWEDLLARFNGKKMLALAEFPGPSDTARMDRMGVHWLYSVSWTGNVGPKSDSKEFLQRVYRSPQVINREALPVGLLRD